MVPLDRALIRITLLRRAELDASGRGNIINESSKCAVRGRVEYCNIRSSRHETLLRSGRLPPAKLQLKKPHPHLPTVRQRSIPSVPSIWTQPPRKPSPTTLQTPRGTTRSSSQSEEPAIAHQAPSPRSHGPRHEPTFLLLLLLLLPPLPLPLSADLPARLLPQTSHHTPPSPYVRAYVRTSKSSRKRTKRAIPMDQAVARKGKGTPKVPSPCRGESLKGWNRSPIVTIPRICHLRGLGHARRGVHNRGAVGAACYQAWSRRSHHGRLGITGQCISGGTVLGQAPNGEINKRAMSLNKPVCW